LAGAALDSYNTLDSDWRKSANQFVLGVADLKQLFCMQCTDASEIARLFCARDHHSSKSMIIVCTRQEKRTCLFHRKAQGASFELEIKYFDVTAAQQRSSITYPSLVK